MVGSPFVGRLRLLIQYIFSCFLLVEVVSSIRNLKAPLSHETIPTYLDDSSVTQSNKCTQILHDAVQVTTTTALAHVLEDEALGYGFS
jgi:hypothetical protein